MSKWGLGDQVNKGYVMLHVMLYWASFNKIWSLLLLFNIAQYRQIPGYLLYTVLKLMESLHSRGSFVFTCGSQTLRSQMERLF